MLRFIGKRGLIVRWQLCIERRSRDVAAEPVSSEDGRAVVRNRRIPRGGETHPSAGPVFSPDTFPDAEVPGLPDAECAASPA